MDRWTDRQTERALTLGLTCANVQVLVELCGGDVADAVRTGGTHALPDDLKQKTQQQCMLVRTAARAVHPSLLPVVLQDCRAAPLCLQYYDTMCVCFLPLRRASKMKREHCIASQMLTSARVPRACVYMCLLSLPG